jgi:hypothetical protein
VAYDQMTENIVSEIAQLWRERDAYKWAYEYMQSRMESIGRHGWAHDCDGEIEHRSTFGEPPQRNPTQPNDRSDE